MSSEILKVNGLFKNFNSIKALGNFSFSLRQGEILGLIGPNGSGKTTLFNIIGGFIPPDQGKVFFDGKDITGFPPYRIASLGISRTFQKLRIIRQISVLENVLLYFRKQPGENLSNVFFQWRKSQYQEDKNRKEAMTLLQVTGLADNAGDAAEGLSYGQQKLLSLVCCLAAKSDVLLLDEPVAGIAPEMIKKIMEIICDLSLKGKSVILIEHNLAAVMSTCSRVVFMDAGAKISEGTPEEVLNDAKVIETYID